jgi:hypothetical protein
MVDAVGANSSQVRVLGVTAFPAEFVDASKVDTFAIATADMDVNVSQQMVLGVVRGRVADPSVKSWTFTLDGHDFYVLKLGNIETLVFDTHSEQWHVWASADTNLWRAYNGANWVEAATWGRFYGSSVVVGDDGNGALYFLNPTLEYDDDAVLGADSPRTFERVVQGQVLNPTYSILPCYGVHMTGSIGDAEYNETSVTLSYSDDRGDSYVDAGTVDVPLGEVDTRLSWRSLGSVKIPGRLFKVTDYGALARIDSLDMEDGQQE